MRAAGLQSGYARCKSVNARFGFPDSAFAFIRMWKGGLVLPYLLAPDGETGDAKGLKNPSG